MSGRHPGNRSGQSATASSSRSARSERGRAARAAKTVTYEEDSDSFEDESSAEDNKPSTRKMNKPSRYSQSHRRQRNTSDASPRPRKKRETSRMVIGQSRPANNPTNARASNRLPSNLPPWPKPAKLPYDVLLSIFQYAAYPLIDQSRKVTGGAAWLVKMALLRRDFLEPAMSALYYSPPLEPALRAHNLFDALKVQSEISLVDYRRKIRFLDIDALDVLVLKCAGREPLNLMDMISMTPMLRGLCLNWENDDPAMPVLFRSNMPTSKVARWYGKQVIELLDGNNIKIIHWKWNFILGPTLDYPWLHLKEIHQLACFRDLKSVEICRLGYNLRRSSKWTQLIESLGSAMGELKQLDNVTISNPHRVSPEDMKLIFKHTRPLVTISFLFCDWLTSECLQDVLATCGSTLHHLTLNHNRCLDASFLSDLRTLSPRLQTLSMDLTLLAPLDSVRSAEPQFTVLLPEGCTPQWPRTLQHLQLMHLRKWDTRAAYRFLASLVEAAPEMRRLRYLGIRMSVDADWRDRIKFRNVWEQRMVRVFQRRNASPHRWTSGGPVPAQQKRPARQATQRGEEEENATSDEDHDETNRGRKLEAIAVAENGTCDRVDVRIENLRPMDKLLKESDFLDAEKEGDGVYGH